MGNGTDRHHRDPRMYRHFDTDYFGIHSLGAAFA